MRVYTSQEVGHDAQTHTVKQDETGTLFFGAGDGLLAYDGERWAHTPIEHGYAIRGLDFGGDGRLWAAGIGNLGWFEHSLPREWKFHSLLPELLAQVGEVGVVWRAFATPQGATFVSEDRILQWKAGRFEQTRLPGPRRVLAARADGTLYVHHSVGGLFALRDNGLAPVIPAELLGDAGLVFIEQRANEWLLGTFQGLFVWRGSRLEVFAPSVSALLRQHVMTSSARLPDGRYAFGTLRGGLVVMRADGTLDQVLTQADGLPTEYLEGLCVDRDGQLWATSRSGIARIDFSSETTLFDRRVGLPERPFLGITKVDDQIVAATDNGAYAVPIAEREPAAKIITEPINYVGTANGALLASGFRWVKRIRGGVAEMLYQPPKDAFAVVPARRRPNSFYVSESDVITLLSPDGKVRPVVQGLPDFARALVEDDTGNLWMSTIARGVFVAQPQPESVVEAVRADGSGGLPRLDGHSVVRATADGSILVFADNGGWLKPAGAQQFRPIKHYPQRAIAAASEFARNGIGWVVHAESNALAACAARITVAGREATWEPHSIAGLPEIGLPRSIFVDATNTGAVKLWIGGTQSVLRHVVPGNLSAPRPRPPLLHTFARHEETDDWKTVRGALPYSTQSVEFEFAEPDFLRRDSLRLQTRIDGIDQDWMPAAPDARRVLTALRDANYTFRVRAVAETGVASEETMFGFRVLPPWWRMRTAIAGEGAALALMLWGAYGWRVRSLRRRNAELETKVRQRTKELEEVSAAKTQFVANMSHDIRNPLNGIVGLVLALENTKLDRRQREVVATLRECSAYLSSLVDDVLDFASIEAGRVELKPGPFVPQELLRSVVNTMKADAGATGALFLVEADPDLPPSILGDAGRIQQILVNFVSNALKYAGGEIRLSVTSPCDTIDEIEFSVSDEGPGISAEEQRTLFTKFTRVKRTQGQDIRGTGLGLAACRLLADLMGGSVGVDSRAGEGARFWLRLPMTIATAPADRPIDALPATTVLLVEDTDYNAWAAEAVLAKLGLSCERARNGVEALEMFGAKQFNVVLLDRNLPDLDGTEVARRMRELETDGAHAVLLAVTAYCTAEDRELCLEAGMDAFVGKPLTPEKLRRVLLETSRQVLATSPAQIAAPAVEAGGNEPDARPPADHTLNWSLFEYLSDGTAEAFEAQVQRFLAELGATEAELCAAETARDYERLRRAAHRLLGHAQAIGDAALAETCVVLQSAARAGDRQACEQAWPRVRAELAALTAAVHRRDSAGRRA